MRSFPVKINVVLLKTFAAYLCVSVVLLLLPAGWTGPVRHTVLYPLTMAQGGLTYCLGGVERAGRSLSRAWREDGEVAALRERVSELEARLAAEREQRRRAEARLELLGHVPERLRLRTVPASLVSYDPSPVRRTVRLNRGSRHGVVRNAVVLWKDAIVGRVESAGAWSCDVVLLGDRRCVLGVRCARTHVQGVLHGLGRDLCSVRYVAASADVRAGDVFVASGTEGIFPKGWLVGECAEASSASGSTYQWVAVRPAFDLARLEEVMIVVPQSGTE